MAAANGLGSVTKMKVSAQEEYGLRCILQIARHQRSGRANPLTLAEITREEGLTVPHVAKLIRTLRKAGLVKSVLGRTGGYSLSQTADKRSEEHTSELQSRPHLVCRLLLEKKNIQQYKREVRKQHQHRHAHVLE